MAVFTSKRDSSYYDSEVDALMESVEIQDMDFEDPYTESMKIVAESEYNHTQLMKAIGMYEVQSYVENGGEVIYESGTLSSIWEKIKSFFKALWEKIKAFFHRVISMFDAYTKSAKEFAQKYKTKIGGMLKNTSDFKFKGYNFTHLEEVDFQAKFTKISNVMATKGVMKASKANDNNLRAIGVDVDDIMDKHDDIVEEMRGAVIGSGSYTASEFSEELFMYFRNGEKDKEELDNPGKEVNTVLGRMLNSDKATKTAKDSFKAYEKGFNEVLKQIEKTKNDLLKTVGKDDEYEDTKASEKTFNYNYTEKEDSKDVVKNGVYTGKTKTDSATTGAEKRSLAVKQLNMFYTFHKTAINIMQQFNAAKMKAIKDQSSQDKQYCVAIMAYKPKNESAIYGEYEESHEEQTSLGSYLNRVVLK